MVHIILTPKYANVGSDSVRADGFSQNFGKKYFTIARYNPCWELRQAVDSLERNLDNHITSLIYVRDQNTITCTCSKAIMNDNYLEADFVIICEDYYKPRSRAIPWGTYRI